jgi:hypothetical protein
MKVGELFVQLGIKADTPAAKEFQSVLRGATLQAAGLITALVGVSLEIRDMVQETLGAAVAFQKFENTSGLSAEKLQQWHNMAERANVSTESVTGAVLALQKNMADIRLGGGNLRPFQLLGISPGDDPFEILEQVRSRIQGMDRPMAVNIMQQMGINPEMINLLGLTADQLKRLASPEMILSEKNIGKLLQANRALKELRIELLAFTRMFIADISPAIKQFATFATNLGNGVHELIVWLEKFPDAMRLVGLSILTVLAIMNPWLAALGAALMLLEDYYIYTKGGKSVIGVFLNKDKEGKTEASKFIDNRADKWIDELGGKPKPVVQQSNKIYIQGMDIDSALAAARKQFDVALSTASDQTGNGGE